MRLRHVFGGMGTSPRGRLAVTCGLRRHAKATSTMSQSLATTLSGSARWARSSRTSRRISESIALNWRRSFSSG